MLPASLAGETTCKALGYTSAEILLPLALAEIHLRSHRQALENVIALNNSSNELLVCRESAYSQAGHEQVLKTWLHLAPGALGVCWHHALTLQWGLGLLEWKH